MTCPNCNTQDIPNDANFCPDCGMYLSYEGLKMTIARYPEGEIHCYAKGPYNYYTPTLRESNAKEHLLSIDSQIPKELLDKYKTLGNPAQKDYNCTADYNAAVFFAINNLLKRKYNLNGMWLVDEKMCHSYRKSKSLLLRVGASVFCIKPVCLMDGYEVVKAEELIWQEIECDKYGYIPCKAFIQQRLIETDCAWLIRNCSIVNAKTGIPIDFLASDIHNRKMLLSEIQLLAIRRLAEMENMWHYDWDIEEKNIWIIKHSDYGEIGGQSYYIEINDGWGHDKVQVAKELRSTYHIDRLRNGSIGCRREPIFYSVKVKSADGGEPTWDDFTITIDKLYFNRKSLMTEEELAQERTEMRRTFDVEGLKKNDNISSWESLKASILKKYTRPKRNT